MLLCMLGLNAKLGFSISLAVLVENRISRIRCAQIYHFVWILRFCAFALFELLYGPVSRCTVMHSFVATKRIAILLAQHTVRVYRLRMLWNWRRFEIFFEKTKWTKPTRIKRSRWSTIQRKQLFVCYKKNKRKNMDKLPMPPPVMFLFKSNKISNDYRNWIGFDTFIFGLVKFSNWWTEVRIVAYM